LALCAPLGGPLAVTHDEGGESEDSYKFVLPRFTAFVELPQSLGASLRAGEFGYVTIREAESQTVARVLNHRIGRWFENKLAEARKHAEKGK
jgi:hypothetical protein